MIDSFPFDEWSEEHHGLLDLRARELDRHVHPDRPRDHRDDRVADRLGVAREAKARGTGGAPPRGGRDSRAGRCSRPDARARRSRRWPARPPTPATRGRIGMIDSRLVASQSGRSSSRRSRPSDPRVTPVHARAFARLHRDRRDPRGRRRRRAVHRTLVGSSDYCCNRCRGSSFTARSAVASRRTGSCPARPGGTWRTAVRPFASAPSARCRTPTGRSDSGRRSVIRMAPTEPLSASRSDRPASDTPDSACSQSAAR